MRNVDWNTLKLLGLINELTEASKNGIIPFSKATDPNLNAIYYDDREVSDTGYSVVADYFIGTSDSNLNCIGATWDDCFDNVVIKVFIDEETNTPCLFVNSEDFNEQIAIENGEWYFTDYGFDKDDE